ncbi:Internalin B precursor [Bythopirellula polymerisocia]|uniref:Internalin B n=2 Tax=Bythopirellula polymerisocia TaxID=2528003 RepID=A0A5C6CXZ5_9BACT|nr:Internalin B precursor [Bythopirellula polymerisocia]
MIKHGLSFSEEPYGFFNPSHHWPLVHEADFRMIYASSVVVLFLMLLLAIAVRQSETRYDTVGYILGALLGLLVGTIYGMYLNQPHLVMTNQSWLLVVSMIAGSFVGLAVALKTHKWWIVPLTTSIQWMISGLLHFSLGTVFILITLSAIGLGIVAHRMSKQRTVQRLLDRNLHLSFDYQLDPSGEFLPETQAPTPKWLRRLVGEDYFRTLKSIRHSGNVDIRDRDMKHLAEFPELEILDLHNNRITGAGLHEISHLHKLKMLDLRDNQIENTGLLELRGMTELRDLNLSENKISDEGLAHLAPLIHLRILDLSDNALTGEGLWHLEGLRELQYLELSENKIVGPELSRLRGMSRLQYVDLRINPLTLFDFQQLIELKNLQTLDLSWTQLDDSQLKQLGDLSSLQNLSISGTDITDKAVLYLCKARGLQQLSINGTKITVAGAAQLQKELPECKIYR